MKINRLIQKVFLVLFSLVVLAYSSSELKKGKETLELQPLRISVEQPFSGKLIILLYQAIELHKNEVGTPLEKYIVRIKEDDEFYYIFFIDPEKDPRMVGSREEVPQYTVIASKETFEILEHYRVK